MLTLEFTGLYYQNALHNVWCILIFSVMAMRVFQFLGGKELHSPNTMLASSQFDCKMV